IVRRSQPVTAPFSSRVKWSTPRRSGSHEEPLNLKSALRPPPTHHRRCRPRAWPMGSVKMPKGPLEGVKIVEFAGVGPGPMGAMLLADLGATVLRLERHDYVQLGTDKPARFNLLTRNRQTLKLNLKEPEGIETAL